MNVDGSAGRILIADEHPIFRDGLRRLLETEPDFEVIGDAGDVAGTLQMVRRLDPDVLLLDVALTQAGRSDVLRDQYALGPEQIADLVRAMVGSADARIASRNPFRLTRRQLEIVSAVALGETNKEVAQHFSISEETVKRHLSSIFDKLGVFSRLELAIFALNHGLVDGDGS